MRETSRASIPASYTIPRGANFDDVALIGRLTVGRRDRASDRAADGLGLDYAPGDRRYRPGRQGTVNTNRPAVYASFAADAVPVNPASASFGSTARRDLGVRANRAVHSVPTRVQLSRRARAVRRFGPGRKHGDEIVDLHDPNALMSECIFCKIVSGEIPAKEVERDGDAS